MKNKQEGKWDERGVVGRKVVSSAQRSLICHCVDSAWKLGEGQGNNPFQSRIRIAEHLENFKLFLIF